MNACTCWVRVVLHDGHCCFRPGSPADCHDEQGRALLASAKPAQTLDVVRRHRAKGVELHFRPDGPPFVLEVNVSRTTLSVGETPRATFHGASDA